MRVRLVRLLAIVVTLVVPIQGMTAVAAGQCMALSDHSDGVHALHEHDMSADVHHGVAAHHHHGGEGGHDAHCPPCVSCCAAAAIASSTAVFVPEQAGSWVVPAPPAFFSGIAPETLDRPPLAL